jgi:thiamine biosynthesis lipoprotein
MGTLCDVVVHAADSASAGRAAAAALDEIARLEQVMSSWRSESELSRLDGSAGRAYDCSPDLFAVLDSAVAYAQATRGAFDPTVEPLLIAWDLRGAGRVPTAAEREAARARVGWQRLRLDRGRKVAQLENGAAVDLGGIGKGFALDRAAERLRALGVDSALLNFGGELCAFGPAIDATRQRGWTVTLADPTDRLRPVASLVLERGAVSTSSQGERGFIAGGRHYGHVLDPRSGLPVESRASVTVVASSATRADALSTAFLVAGRDSARAWAERHPADGVVWLEPAESAVRMWCWNVRPSAVAGSRLILMQSDESAAHQSSKGSHDS